MPCPDRESAWQKPRPRLLLANTKELMMIYESTKAIIAELVAKDCPLTNWEVNAGSGYFNIELTLGTHRSTVRVNLPSYELATKDNRVKSLRRQLILGFANLIDGEIEEDE